MQSATEKADIEAVTPQLTWAQPCHFISLGILERSHHAFIHPFAFLSGFHLGTRRSDLITYPGRSICLTTTMDPVTALGIAAATVQFINFAGDILSKSREIYQSADGLLTTQTEIDTIAKSLRSLCSPFRFWDPASGARRRPHPTELQLYNLCRDCIRVSNDLEDALKRLKEGGGHHQRWNSFRQALNAVKSESEIEQLCQRMERIRNQIATVLLFTIR